MKVDLHAHSDASDGDLEPRRVVELQAAAGITLAALTDHDTLGGWDRLANDPSSVPDSMRLLPGIELSASESGLEIHVVGLGFDPKHACMRDAVEQQRTRRLQRAGKIGARLRDLGIELESEAVAAAAGGVPGRPHFARLLVASGRVRSEEEAFRRYLGHGRPAAVPTAWPDLQTVVSWVLASGGVAVLAHPMAYGLGTRALRRLAAEFRDCGGTGIEVSLPNLAHGQLPHAARLAREFGLKASAGSDFHSPRQPWRMPGKIPPLPDFLSPIWHDWL